MKHTRFFLLTLLGLSASTLRADDPAPARVLTLDASGHPRADLNLSSPHVTGTLDAARLPAGVGGAFLAGVNKPTGDDATALDHADVSGVVVGDVRQVRFTTGDDLVYFNGGTDANGDPLTFVAATYRLINSTDPTALPDLVATQTAGKAWRLASAALSTGDVILPNGILLTNGGVIGVLNGGGINLQNGGSINTTNGGGDIDTRGNGDGYYGGTITTTAGSYQNGGYISTSGGGYINTSLGGGFVNTSGGGGNIDTSLGGSIITGLTGTIDTSGGGYISTSGGGNIDTTNGGGNIKTSGHGSPEGVESAPVGSFYSNQDGGPDGDGTPVFYVKESGNGTEYGWVAK